VQLHEDITTIVIDNDKDISDNLAHYLTKSGYSVTNTYTGKEGLALIDKQHPRIALMDLKLPDINGIELLKSIKAASPETIIILISGYATIDATAEAIKYGAYDFIAKPFNFDELELILCLAIELKTRKEKLRSPEKKKHHPGPDPASVDPAGVYHCELYKMTSRPICKRRKVAKINIFHFNAIK
jgi:DNA-binding NtrC family response regulator